MRAVAKLAAAPGKMVVIDRPEPVRKPDEVLVSIAAAGICGTDVAIWRWHEAVVGQYAPTFPVTVGHEFAGHVVEAPADSGLEPGMLVAINPQIGCGHCKYCGLGRPTLCDDRKLMGGHVDGGWTEMVCVPVQQVFPLPEGVDPAVAPLLEPMAVAVHAVLERVPVRAGDIALVIGAGPIGLLCGILALHAGAAKVVVTGIGADVDRLALARDLGMLPVDVDVSDPIVEIGSLGADVVYETSGNAAVAEQALALAGKAGRVALIGLCHGPSTFVTTPAVLKEVELIGSRGYNDPTWRLVMQVLPGVAMQVTRLVTHRFKLEQFEDALEAVAKHEGVKILLEP
ncbi:alcohol dehydrogenase catalytic domain-containing protein [Oricola sp.]|uniref:zinc-dependent alcohol dehydrogenase n=1 Tax=Oricola sp. TaxID=1979950 RepID=UPI0025D591EC|nr:alcohol dehydrogenase catalytic domain-containing protein [Oricola sp.]MCI5077331.1 alcohol dehydrogenase catalytic domain-containing protein [Oricola sp.]